MSEKKPDVSKQSAVLEKLRQAIQKVIIGQSALIDRILMAILCDGHLLLEGVPGLAKTLAVKATAQAIKADFKRIQFTPDLLPADLVGTMVFNPKSGNFNPRLGPVFTNLLLADEINRAPAKVQSALLEAMQERQVTIGEKSYPLERLFLVMATQNPIEQEGTYPLPEAQVDRFLMKVRVSYPERQEEMRIMVERPEDKLSSLKPAVTPGELLKARAALDKVYVDERIKNYVLDIAAASRDPESSEVELKGLISYGVSPRATTHMLLVAKAQAFLEGRGYVMPEDVKEIAPDVLRHRLILTYEAEAEEISADDIVKRLLEGVKIP